MARVLATLFLFSVLILALWIGKSSGELQRPTDAIKNTIAKLRNVLKNPQFKGDIRKQEKRDELKRTLWSRFSLEEFSHRSLGKYWPADHEKQRDFTALFKALLEHMYLEQIEQLDDRVIIIYAKERIDGDYGEVETVVKQGSDIKMNYKLKLLNEEWMVYDVVIEDVSIVNNYRSQFYRKLLGRSFEDLLKEMREKVEEINRKNKKADK